MPDIADDRTTILLVSPYWREPHRWMVSSVKLAELWQRMGYRVHVVCMAPKTETTQVSPTLTIHGVKDVFLRDPWNYGIARGFSRRVLAVARSTQPSLVVVNKVLFWSSLSIFRLRRAGYHVLLLTDTLVGFTWWPRGTAAKIGAYLYARTLGWLVLRSAHRIVFFHPQPEPLLRRLGIAQRSQVIPTGIDAAQFIGQRAEGGGQAQAVTITYVGRLESVKGVDDLLAVAQDFVAEHANVRFLIAGHKAEGNACEKQYSSERITFLGLRDDVPSLLRETDIFVLPSHSEGLSNALMEAMAAGCACVATAVGGNLHLIEDGVSGLLYQPGHRAALAHHLHSLVGDAALRVRLGDAARRRIMEHFDWSHVARRYQELFRDLATHA